MGRLDDSRRAPVAVLALLGTLLRIRCRQPRRRGVRPELRPRVIPDVKTARPQRAIDYETPINTKYEYKYSSVKYSGRDELLRRGTRAARALIPSHI